jgi:hypothetical protein
MSPLTADLKRPTIRKRTPAPKSQGAPTTDVALADVGVRPGESSRRAIDLVMGTAGSYRDIVIRHAPTEEERAARQREGLLSFFHGPPQPDSSPALRASDVLTEMDALPLLVHSSPLRDDAPTLTLVPTPTRAPAQISELTPQPVAYSTWSPAPPAQRKIPSVPPPPVDLPARSKADGWGWAATALTLAACLALVITGLLIREQRALSANASAATSAVLGAVRTSPVGLRPQQPRALLVNDLPQADQAAPVAAAVLVAPHLRQHRIWLDGALLRSTTDAGQPVACGRHTLRVGSSGARRNIDVPCGTAYVIEQ